MTVRVAVVKKGQLLLEEPLPFPDGTRVQVQVEPADGVPREGGAEEVNPLLFAAEHAVDTGIPDLAEEHDHYIYGSPKRSEKP